MAKIPGVEVEIGPSILTWDGSWTFIVIHALLWLVAIVCAWITKGDIDGITGQLDDVKLQTTVYCSILTLCPLLAIIHPLSLIHI